MDIKSAKALALWLFPEWATWGEAKPGNLNHPTDGSVGAWATPPDAWRGDGPAGVQSADGDNDVKDTVEVAVDQGAKANDDGQSPAAAKER